MPLFITVSAAAVEAIARFRIEADFMILCAAMQQGTERWQSQQHAAQHCNALEVVRQTTAVYQCVQLASCAVPVNLSCRTIQSIYDLPVHLYTEPRWGSSHYVEIREVLPVWILTLQG